MINLNDQEELFKLISRKIKKDISCFAFGGTAMMYYGYKNTTKDIDILFNDKNMHDEFIQIIKNLGYNLTNPNLVYKDKKKEKPTMLSRGEERFDIFFKRIFNFTPSDKFKKRFFARYDYKEGKNTFTIYVATKEDIILLKSVTERETDFQDILTIIEKEREINWEIIIEEAISQKNQWIKIDLEETMQKLKEKVFLPDKYFKKLYNN